MNRHAEIAPLNTSFVHSTQFPSPPGNGGIESGKRGRMSPPRRSSLPPRPPSSQIPTTRKPIGLENFNPGPRIRQSISQPSPAPVFSFGSLPTMSPAPSCFRYNPSAPVSNHNAALPPLPFTRPTAWGASGSTLPPRKIHRRAKSDSVSGLNPLMPEGGMRLVYPKPVEMPVGVKKSEKSPGEKVSDEEDGDNSYMDIIDQLFDISNEDGVEKISGDSEKGKSSAIENGRKATSGVKRRAGKEIAPSRRKIGRSFSVDCNLNGKSSSIGGELHPSLGNLQGVDGNENASQIDKGEFTASEMEKIMCSERLKELAVTNPKQVRRSLANRKAAARSKERKAQDQYQLEGNVDALETKVATLKAHSKLWERANLAQEEENKQLRILVEGMEEKARLGNALFEHLTGEVHRLKQATGEVIPNPREYGRSNGQSVDADMLQQLNLNQLHQQPQTNFGFDKKFI